jgi:hypothetical protein
MPGMVRLPKTWDDDLYAIGRFEFDRSLRLSLGRNRP